MSVPLLSVLSHMLAPTSVPLPTIQSETWLVQKQIHEPHMNSPICMNFRRRFRWNNGESLQSPRQSIKRSEHRKSELEGPSTALLGLLT